MWKEFLWISRLYCDNDFNIFSRVLKLINSHLIYLSIFISIKSLLPIEIKLQLTLSVYHQWNQYTRMLSAYFDWVNYLFWCKILKWQYPKKYVVLRLDWRIFPKKTQILFNLSNITMLFVKFGNSFPFFFCLHAKTYIATYKLIIPINVILILYL